MSNQERFIRYLLLSPSSSIRQDFIGAVFETFELSPRGRGEKVTFFSDSDDTLEIIGMGETGNLDAMSRKLFERNVKIDGILALLTSGDTDSLEHTQSLARWLKSSQQNVPMRTWVFESQSEIDKETAKKTLLALMADHEEVLKANR